MTDRKDINIEELRKALLDRKAELQAHSAESVQTRDAVELDQTRQGRLSRQDALMQQEMAKETERRRQFDIQKIEAALSRIESSDYGYCVSCDEEITAKRLLLDPAVAVCIECASKAEA